eukprot:gene7770-956_t
MRTRGQSSSSGSSSRVGQGGRLEVVGRGVHDRRPMPTPRIVRPNSRASIKSEFLTRQRAFIHRPIQVRPDCAPKASTPKCQWHIDFTNKVPRAASSRIVGPRVRSHPHQLVASSKYKHTAPIAPSAGRAIKLTEARLADLQELHPSTRPEFVVSSWLNGDTTSQDEAQCPGAKALENIPRLSGGGELPPLDCILMAGQGVGGDPPRPNGDAVSVTSSRSSCSSTREVMHHALVSRRNGTAFSYRRTWIVEEKIRHATMAALILRCLLLTCKCCLALKKGRLPPNLIIPFTALMHRSMT